MLIIYVMAIFVFIGMLAVVLDISWYWINSNRVQKAADAAALAGVVWLPADEPKAVQTAIYEATKNGYAVASNGVALNGVKLTAAKASDGRRLNVTLTATIPTFFMRVFGLNSIPSTRIAQAEYVSPVAMGSPENYYGVFGTVRDATMTTTAPPTTGTSGNTATSAQVATLAPGTASWTPSSGGSLIAAVNTNDTIYARTSTNNAVQQWGTFGLGSAIPNSTSSNPVKTTNITGIVVNLDDAFMSAVCSSANSQIGVRLNWANGAGTTWSSQVKTGTLTTNTTSGDFTLGAQTNTTAWGTHNWLEGDFTDANFRVELQALRGCTTTGLQFNVDRLRVTVYYTVTTYTTFAPVTSTAADFPMFGPGSPCINGVAGCYQARPTIAGVNTQGQSLNARGFWATMNSEGAPNLNGDAFQPFYAYGTTAAPAAPNCPTTTLTACYDPDNYYNYAVEMLPNTTGGYVYIFDPAFCATAINSGTGDYWFSTPRNPVSSYYELYDTGTSIYTRADDTLIVSSGSTFEGMALGDGSMGGSGGTDCRQSDTAYTGASSAANYHNSWYLLNPSNPLTGGPTGTTYRVHTTGTNPSNVAQQQNVSAEQTFAIFATGSTLPKVYGIGAMQMFTPLEANSSPDKVSSFYLAQIDPIHAGRTLELHLWDPGDTRPLIADLAFMIPTSTGWTTTPFSYSAKVGTSGTGPNTACNTNTGAVGTTSIRTNNGNTAGNFNGCWLTIDIPIPPGYTGQQQGWWQIQYTMHNSTSGLATSSDVTTWTAEIQGNPVHLVAP